MPPAWRLATSNLSRRPSRTALLALAVACSAALIVCVACTMASIHNAINHQLASTVGAADLRLRPLGARELSRTLVDRVAAWPEVADAAPRLHTTIALSVRRAALFEQNGDFRRRDLTLSSTALANALRPRTSNARAAPRAGRGFRALAPELAPDPDLIAGRLPAADDEIAIDTLLAYSLSAQCAIARDRRDGFTLIPRTYAPPTPTEVPPTASASEAARINAEQRIALGDTVEVVRRALPGIANPFAALGFSQGTTLKVVGIVAQPPLGGRPQAYMTLSGLVRLAGESGLSQIDVALHPGFDPETVAAARRPELADTALLETSDKVTSGLDRNMQSSQLGMILATVMAAISAAFIITTGLTTGVTERQRELAMLRCIGAMPGQLARTQLLIGLVIGALGALIGVPLGVGIAWFLATVFAVHIPTGLVVTPNALLLGAAGAVAAGLAGAAWPAWRTARLSPLAGLASRARPPRPAGLIAVSLCGLLGLAYQAAAVGLPDDGQTVFWLYTTSGLPLMFIGYFLLGVPAVLLVSRLAAPLLSRLLSLPPRLLHRTVAATPYRHGFTAGALMGGLALMVAIWTNGGAMLRDWIGKIQFPDAFVSGLNLTEAHQRRLEAMDIVARTAAITAIPVETDAFGVRALQRYKTTFFAFEPDPFLDMTTLKWVQGDPAAAVQRLKEGGAVIVAREFLIAQGLGVGDRFTCRFADQTHEFEIVGVVASPGLEIASKFFNVGEDYTDQAIHAVFGSRDDAKHRFFAGQPAPIQLIQIQFSDRVPPGGDETALEYIRAELAGAGLLDAGSGRQIKEQIHFFATGAMLVFSAIALAAMLVACFGVANLIVASVETRRFEFGVLRAVGAQPNLLTRLVLAETLLIALAAAAMGTLMGLQGSWAGRRLYGLLLGLDLSLQPPLGPIAAAWLIVAALALAAAAPAVWWLNRQRPRDLLTAMKG